MTDNMTDVARSLDLSDTKGVKGFIGKAAREFARVSETAEKASGRATEVGAIATYVAEKAGVLAPGGAGSRATDGQMSTKDWAASFITSKAGSKVSTVAPTQIPLWRTLGHAVMVAGVPVTTDDDADGGLSTWRLLAFRGAGGVKEVAEAVKAEDATPESIRTACLLVRNPDGSRLNTGNGGAGTPRSAGGTDADAESVAAMVAADPVGAAVKAVEVLAGICKAIPVEDREGWSKVEDAIAAILKRENTLRVVKATAKRATAKKVTTRKVAEKIPA